MNILSLRYFIAVAECGSFTRASETMYTTQPNISKHIKQLESEFQAPLFIRSGKSTRLTDLGELILADVKQVVTTVDKLQDKAFRHNVGKYGQLAIGYTNYLNPYYIATIMSSFCASYPSIEVSFARGNQESELLDKLYSDDLDVIITSALDSSDDEKICQRVISLNKIVVVVPKEHRLSHFNAVKKEDLAGEPVILHPRHMSPVFYDWITKFVSVKNKNTIVYENDLQNILLKVAAGKGLAIMSTLFVNSTIENVQAVKLEYDPNEINVDIVMAYKKDKRNPALSLLMQGVQS